MMWNRCALCVAAAIATLLCSCGREADCLAPEEQGNDFFPSEMQISLGEDETRTGYEYLGDGRLKTVWKDGDAVFVAPAFRSGIGTTYRVREGGAATGTFIADGAIMYTTKGHAFYYPGQKIHNDAGFVNFSYQGQIQKKSDPMAHMAEFHAMRKEFIYDSCTNQHFDPSNESFAGCDQSGCIRFVLSGQTFENPVKVQLSVVSGPNQLQNVLVSSNYLSPYYLDDTTGDTPGSLQTAGSLSVALEGYGTEDQLVVYMMHSNYDMQIPAGSSLRVTVIGDRCWHADTQIKTATAIKGGYASTLTVTGGWVDEGEPQQPSGDYTKYPWDGEVVTLQERGSGLDLVIMGDGFIKEDFDDGTYDTIMRQAYNEFFSMLPVSLFREDFNVYYVKVPSPERVYAVNTGLNGAENSGTVTKFSARFTPNSTHMSGDDNLVREYARKAFRTDADERIKNATIVVMVNQACRAGTCWNSWSTSNGCDYGQSCAVAYCALGHDTKERIELIHHEVNGHGFGKLADEYTSSSSTNLITSLWYDLDEKHEYGMLRNADKYIDAGILSQLGGSGYSLTDESNVYWHDLFGTANGYESPDTESLGVYKGGYTYSFMFCRPTQDGSQSVMNQNTGRFNAISRRQMYYRYRRLSGQLTENCYGTPAELDAFLEWDRQHFSELYQAQTKASCVERSSMLIAPSVMVKGEWREGVFYPL